jgi:hypothetical protein
VKRRAQAVLALGVAGLFASVAPQATGSPTAGAMAPSPDAQRADGVAPSAGSEPAPPLVVRVGAYSTTAFGLSGGGFLNELAGARVDLDYTPRFSLGFGLAYANLKGKYGRTSNVLPEAMLGYRVPLGRVVGLPFHLAGGYLPKNGPTLRLGAGVDFRLGERARLEFMLLEPMVWVTKDRPESSLNLGIGLNLAF